MEKALLLTGLFFLFAFPAYGQTASNLDVNVDTLYPDSEYVLGRELNSTYEYELDINSAQVAFAVDETYSMSGPMNGVRNNIQWFFGKLSSDAEGTVVGSGAGSASNHRNPYHFTDDPYPSSALPEPRDLGVDTGLMENKTKLENAAGRLRERTYFEGPDSTVSEALNFGPEASDYTGNIGYYGDEAYGWNTGSSKAIIWVQSGQAGYGSCSDINDFSGGGMGDYMKNNGFEFYAIVRSLSGCRSKFENAAQKTGGEVYDLSSSPTNSDWQGILGNISGNLDTSVKLNSVIDENSYSDHSGYNSSNLIGSGHKRYRYLNAPEADGLQSLSLIWRPTDYGTLDIESGDSYMEVEQSDGSFLNFYFNNQMINDVKYVDFSIADYSISRDSSDVRIEAEISNSGNVDTLSPSQTSNPRKLFVKDSSNTVSVSMPSVPAGGTKNVTMSIPNSNPVVDSTSIEDIFIHADDVGYWDGKSSKTPLPNAEGEALEPNEMDNDKNIGYVPRVRDITFKNISGQHAFQLNSTIDILTGENNYGTCKIKFTNQENGNKYPITGSVQGNMTKINSNTAKCSYQNFNSSVPGFEPTDNVKVNITVENDEGAKGWNTANNEIRNKPPTVTILGPKGGEPVWERDAELSIDIDDPEGDNITKIELWDHMDSALIDSFPTPAGGTDGDLLFKDDWEDLNLGKFEWRAEVEDKWSKTVAGPENFERVVSQNYRVQHEIDYTYSSLIVDEGGQSSMFLETDVITDNRTVTTHLEGNNINVSYADGSSQKTYEVDTGNPERFQLKVKGLDTGKNELKITTEDDSVTTNTTTTFPVYVRKSTAENRTVPGLSLYYLVFIAFFSSLLYFASL